MDVFITVDTEIWPVHDGGWPHRPLSVRHTLEREFDAYMMGNTRSGSFGLPYQLDVLGRHGLNATYFVDPMFSFAVGLGNLAQVVNLIQAGRQAVELHLHPEWLTDPRCSGLGDFRGPLLSEYPECEQAALVELGKQRLLEAGAGSISAFRAGSWGCDLATLRVLRQAGIKVDSSLNAAYDHTFPSLPTRDRIHDPVIVDGVTEIPITRFSDGLSRCGRPLSLVGVSSTEMQHVLNQCHAAGRKAVVIVLHSNEFARTERLWRNKPVVPRRLVARRFESLCHFLAMESSRFRTRTMSEAAGWHVNTTDSVGMPSSTLAKTMSRMGEQLLSRWF